MSYKIIACVNKNGSIGKNGQLLYHISDDMKNFKSQTIGNAVIMGRKTFESLPNGRPLKDRINIILTSDMNYRCKINDTNVFVLNSIEDIDYFCRTVLPHMEWFVIGGSKVYDEFLSRNLCDELRLTIVDDELEGDTNFPTLDMNEWTTYYKSSTQYSGEIKYEFQVLRKKKRCACK